MSTILSGILLGLVLLGGFLWPVSNRVPCRHITNTLTGTVKGTVIAPNEGVILNVDVIIKSAGFSRTVHTDLDGRYEADLPAGIYEIGTEVAGWYSVRRARFCIRPGAITTLTLAPPVRVDTIGIALTADGTREPLTTLPRPGYDSFAVPFSPKEELELVIQWLEKRRGRGVVVYKDTTASYDSLTVSAKSIRFYPRSRRIEAFGDVAVEEHGQRKHANRATVEFIDSQAIVKIL